MKAKLFLLLALTSFTCIAGFSQSPIEITGQIKDRESKKSLEFCTVTVFNPKDSLIGGAVSDENGFFALQIPRGMYRFNFSYVGYQTDTLKNIPVTENKFIGLIKMTPDVNILKEVAVSSSSNENQIDREVQIVTDKMKAGATTTKEVLDKMKGVDYDRYTNAIKVDNSSNVIILVDGMEKDQEYIKNISPDRLKKVEVIRDPSGRYALEGYTAVINIILKKDYRGTEVFVQNNNLLDVDASKPEYIFVQEAASATVNYTYNKLNMYAKANSFTNSFNLKSWSVKEFTADSLSIEQNPVGDDINTKVKQMYNSLTYGTDYTLNPKHTFSFEGNLTLQPTANNRTSEDFTVLEKKNNQLINSYGLNNQAESNPTSSYYSFFYDGKVDENNSFRSNITFSNYNEHYNNNSFINDILLRNEVGTNLKNKLKFYVEYDHIFNSKHNIQFGYGNSYEDVKNSFEIEKEKTVFKSTDFRHKFYTYYGYQMNKKLGIKVGSALETSNPKTSLGKKSYVIYLPYADVKYKVSDLLDFKFKYRSNSEYPSLSQTNPFESRIDNQSVRIGNPALKPEVTHRLSLESNILQGLVKIEPYYHFSNNYIADIGRMVNDSMMQFSYDNVGKYTNYGALVNFTIPFSKKIVWQNDFNFFNTSIEYQNNVNSTNDFTMSSQLLYISEKAGFVGGVKYQKENRKYLTAQGFNHWNNDFWLLFAQKTFCQQRMSVMVAYISPISYGVNYFQGSYFKTDRYTETKTNDITILKNIFIVELSYRFNKGKSVNKREKEVDVKNEKSSRGIM
jgi:hypothetical protein